ncbi:unnamed protein product [Arabidopsis arenosa]|uniref:Uncharacterized protein n=1 Tax=Arabidopsis arenosa TaxID=38785 RepID=A0A8S1ZVE3_ARAAE|nr:unnamed protein product [Arabidopsis arenosa]
MANNLQNEIDPDLEGIFVRSEFEWLNQGDVHNILAKREDLPTSTVPIQFPEHGLFLFNIDEQLVLDTIQWDMTKSKVWHGQYIIRYKVNQCFLVAIDEGVSTTYERRAYKCEDLYGSYRLVHYRTYFMSGNDSEDENSGDDTEDSHGENMGENETSDDDDSSDESGGDDDSSDDDDSDESGGDDDSDESGGDDDIEANGDALPLANGFC